MRASVCLLMLVFHAVLGPGTNNAIIPFTALLGFLLNGPYYLAARMGRWLRAQAFLRMCADIVLVTLGLYSAGGLAAAPFIGVYAIIPVYAGIAFSSLAALLATWVATASYLAVVALQHGHWIPATASETSSPWVVVFFNLLILNLVGGLTTLLAHAYRTSLRRAREGEERLRAMTETATDAIISSDSAGHITSWNHGAHAMFGYARDEVLGRPLTLLIAEASRDAYQNALERLRSGGEATLIGYTIELQGLTKSGKEFPSELSLSSWSAGPERFSTAIIRDLTDRKQLEAQLRQAQKMEAVGRLAGGVAHDFNNLLTVIMGRAALLLRRHTLDEAVRRETELIEQAGRKASELTRQLLAFGRKQVLQPKVLDLNGVITEIEPMLRRLIGEDIDLLTVRDAALRAVKADPSQMEQVVMNLTVNARDAMPQGGRLTIETANARLNGSGSQGPATVPPGRYSILSVSDTGMGMDKDTLGHIFEPFFTTKEPGKGTGLGLATVYGIVTQSGGHVTVSSERGQGTTFTIYLPQTEEAVMSLVIDTPPFEAPSSETVLVVEDEGLVRGLICDVLQGQGYSVLEAPYGGEALLVAERHPGPIHLLITDMVMPQMSGRELAQRLVPKSPGMKVLYISGYTDDLMVHRNVSERTTAFLQKPFTADSLLRKARDVLEGRVHPRVSGL